jgi:LPXTG-motif cell wall-anchored protein
MKMESSNTGFWVVIGLAVVGGAGYWFYKKNLESKVQAVSSTSKILGIF